MTPGLVMDVDRSMPGLRQLRAAGELGVASVPTLLEAVTTALDEAAVVVLDLRRLSFCDTAGVHAVLDADVAARKTNAWLVVIPAPSAVHRTFELTCADRLLQVFGTPASSFAE